MGDERDIVRTWGAPFEAQGKAVLRPYTELPVDRTRLNDRFGSMVAALN
jgi:hypothetical protein